MRFAVPGDSDVSSWASTDSLTSTVQPIKPMDKYSKKAIIVQELGGDRSWTEYQDTMTRMGQSKVRVLNACANPSKQHPPLPVLQPELAPRGRACVIPEHGNDESQVPGTCRSVNGPETFKSSKRQSLRRRVSKLFTGPHNASLEPRRAPSQVLEPYSFLNVVYRGTPLAATHVMVPVYRLLPSTTFAIPKSSLRGARQPKHSFLNHIDTIYEDGSSVADYSTPVKYDGQRDSRCSIIEPTVHSQPNMQFLPLATHDPFVLSPFSHQRANILDSFKTASTVSDHGVFDSRNGGPPVRGLHRNFQGHHEQLAELQRVRQALGRKHFEQALNIGSDWAAGDVTWVHNANELAGFSPGDRAAAVKLAEQSAGNRKGYVVEKIQENLPTSHLTAMDTDSASRDWHIQPRNHKENSSHISTSPIITSDDRDADLPRAPTRHAGRGLGPSTTAKYVPSATSRPSLVVSDALKAAPMEQAAFMSATHISTRNEFIKNNPLTTPIAFRSCDSKYPDQARSGKMISTTQLPSPLPSVIDEYTGPETEGAADVEIDAANEAFFSPSPASVTVQVATLVRTLEDERAQLSTERDQLLAEIQTLLSALSESQEFMHSGIAAYDALKGSIDQQIQELSQRNCELHTQLGGQEGEAKFLKEMLAERDGQIENMRRQFEGGLGEFFGSTK